MPHTALLDLSIEAGNAILDVYGSAFGSESKADGSPVTVADEAAEKIILAGLSDLFPSVPVVAEEAVEAGNLPQAASRYFLVDPLDGTKEFIARNGEFTVNIALIDAGVPVFGVVYAPALGEIYWGGALPEDLCGEASPTTGAFAGSVADGEIGEVRSIAVRAVPAEGLTVLASRSHLSPETSALIEKLTVAEMVSVGSSLKLCWVAAAKADFYPRLAPTMQWDIGAGDAVLRAAGGEVLVAETRAPLSYEVKPGAVKADLLNPFFLAMSTPSILENI
ncbi:3'(2'),5'-bisphosphate nucleotidase CysQ [Roseibium suaedae]|uniref:3'(2'),5'-bisphosphate nucleotidase CysQ n=1 Tax=Roseibium suaedae TaxID=735517 RepID=A0A1M7KR07_9HYPH|nr:3'(2'),5'-bisphosphate nucleotidase CysQ [Roseibium suaedae]SHM67873.1 3'(2'),5'-bisphosphate nucleotidase [Roseibium suaedae]